MTYTGTPANLRKAECRTRESALKKSLNSQNTFSSAQKWEQMSMSSAQGAAALNFAYSSCTFDGRYMYFASANAAIFIRFLANNTNTPGPIEYAQVSS